ncbi:hypothetical protein [Actinokineospora sp. UTMC 2448]|uniref:hypothetical protein n=1 Tax=Actinokineospora sp. UTMC 2448 TaxID=2268449 RepID=UPI002164E6A9|nr:hypothetical protein [Actinokineospora sp. UTMC 2448]
MLVGVALGAAAGCTDPGPPPPPDPLAALADRARADAAQAAAIASAVPSLAEGAGEVARVRGEHATALKAEVERERPPVSTTASAPPTTPPTAPKDEKAALKALTDGLTAAQKEAAGLVPALPRYRAGLVGSVTAACASLREVL